MKQRKKKGKGLGRFLALAMALSLVLGGVCSTSVKAAQMGIAGCDIHPDLQHWKFESTNGGGWRGILFDADYEIDSKWDVVAADFVAGNTPNDLPGNIWWYQDSSSGKYQKCDGNHPLIKQQDFVVTRNAENSYTISGINFSASSGKRLIVAILSNEVIESFGTPQESYNALLVDLESLVEKENVGRGVIDTPLFECVDITDSSKRTNISFDLSKYNPEAGIYLAICAPPVTVDDGMKYYFYTLGACPNPAVNQSSFNEMGDNTKKDVTSVSLNKSATSLKVGATETLTATVLPADATYKDVKWSSDKESVATVDSTGKVTAKAEGKATITVTTLDGNKTDSCEVTVTSDSGNTPSGSGKVDVPKDKEQGNFGAGGLANTVAEIQNAVLTKEDKDAIAEGKNINVWAEITKQEANKVKDAEKQKITAKLPATFNIGAYLDIKLFKQMTGDDVPTSIEKTNGKVKIKFTVPKELQKGGRTYDIIRLHDGEATVLGVTRKGYELTIETDGFSTYALIYSDNPAVSTNTNKAVTSPKTGESSTPYSWMVLLIASAFALTALKRKRES